MTTAMGYHHTPPPGQPAPQAGPGCAHYFADIHSHPSREAILTAACTRCGVTHHWPATIDLTPENKLLQQQLKEENHMADQATHPPPNTVTRPPGNGYTNHTAIAMAAQADRPAKPAQGKDDPQWGSYIHQAGDWFKRHHTEITASIADLGPIATCSLWRISNSTLASNLSRRRAPAHTDKPIKVSQTQQAQETQETRGTPSPLAGWKFFNCMGDQAPPMYIILDFDNRRLFVTPPPREIPV